MSERAPLLAMLLLLLCAHICHGFSLSARPPSTFRLNVMADPPVDIASLPEMRAAVQTLDAATVSRRIEMGEVMDEADTEVAFLSVVRAVNQAEAEDKVRVLVLCVCVCLCGCVGVRARSNEASG